MMSMQYELYVDSLFLIHFVMNLYILILVNNSTNGSATPGRLLLGAIVGGMGSVFVFFLNGPMVLKLLLQLIPGSFGMLMIVFPVKGFRNWMKLLERTVLISVCMGGVITILVRVLCRQEGLMTGTLGLLGIGGIAYLFIMRQVRSNSREGSYYSATLIRGKNRVTVVSLKDTGNSLTEPVSGKPVCVVDEKVFSCLWGSGEQEYYRAIPFHSIGKQKGILHGYLLPELWLEQNGMKCVYRDVYIAVSPEYISVSSDNGTESVKMIINPLLLCKKHCNGVRRGQNERKNDIKSVNTGKNAVQNDSQRQSFSQ